MTRHLLLIAAPLTLAGCMTLERSPDVAATGGAALRDASGADRGSVSVRDTAVGLWVRIEARGLPPGGHGVHLHATGRCDAPDFQSAGAHWNPAMKQHGRDNPAGAHNGDLPNITVAADGRAMLEMTLPDTTIAGLLDGDGSALLIHASVDDYRTDPSGHSGARIACGVIERR